MQVEVSGPMSDPRFMRAIGEELAKKLEAETARAAVQTANHARTAVQSGGQGRIYEKYMPRRTHRASAPGQPPATDTGRLAASITQARAADGGWLTGSKVNYSKWLEFGTRTMAARPFFRPSLRKAVAEWRERVTNLAGGRSVRFKDIK